MFNDRLRSTRISRGATQQKTADAMGMSLRHYQKYESGEIEPDLNRLVLLADFFQGVPNLKRASNFSILYFLVMP